MVLNGNTLPDSIYISLNSRASKGDYHGGIVVTDANNVPTLYHASNRKGPWELEAKTGNPGKSMTLIVLVKVGNVTKNGIAAVIQQVPADGRPSKRTGEAFNCLTWMKDALAHLAAKGNVALKADVETLQQMANKYAAKYASSAERGKGAYVVNSPTTGSQDSGSSVGSTKSTKSAASTGSTRSTRK